MAKVKRFGEIVKKLREKKNITRYRFAKDAGIDRGHPAKIETLKLKPPQKEIEKIVKALGLRKEEETTLIVKGFYEIGRIPPMLTEDDLLKAAKGKCDDV